MTPSELEALRDRIAGPEPVLLIEAPAGYGKTEEAVVAAARVADGLPEGREVLFLTHTNGARDTFNRRLGRRAAVMKTIHSLAAEIVDLYATPLALPRPLQPFRGKPSFDDMVRLAIDVLVRRPEVARGLALRHPLILVDEYQDCSRDQHELVQVIAAAAPTRLRLFGDDLQGIFEFTGMQVDWLQLTAACPTATLTTPWRWRERPQMAHFLVGARRALLAGAPIDLRSPPGCVTVHRWNGRVPSPFEEGHAPECLDALRACARPGTLVITHHNTHALSLRRKLPGLGRYHEGADHEPARKVLEAVVAAHGDPPVLAALLVSAMQQWGVGMTKPYRDQAAEICRPDGVVTGTKMKILPFARLCERLYERPNTAGWLDCLRRVLDGEHGIESWNVLRGDPIYLLARLRPGPGDDPVALLHREARARDAIRSAPENGFMTIHKAKGLEFDSVALPYCAGSLFEDDVPSRRRMYVAISRARSRLHLLPGSFEDAQLYMGHLVVFSTEGDARLVELQALTARLEAKYPAWEGVLTFAFARNDWLTGGVMTSLARNPLFAQALNTAVDQVVGTELSLSEDEVDLFGLRGFSQDADVILDTVFYGSRLYLGTTSGLFDYDIDWQGLTVTSPRQRLDARCVSATAEYGAVNASCEQDGLFTGYDEFGWRRHAANGSPGLTQTAPRSVRTSWYGTDLVNYEGTAKPELLRASVEQVSVDGGAAERERKVVTRFSAPTDELDRLVRELAAQRKVPKDDVQFVWNSSRAFFINTHTHGFFTAYRTTTTESGVRFTRHGSTNGRVVGVHRFARGWVIETDFRAYVLTGGRLVELLDQEPLSVRTFEGSKRYRRLIAITVESGVHLVSAVDNF